MKSDRTIRQHLKQLREQCIDGTDDLVLKRIAYEVECAVRWAREDVMRWPGLAQQARDGANLLKQELATSPERGE